MWGNGGWRVTGQGAGCSRASPSHCHCRGQLGSLRLTVRLLEDRVLPQHCYQPLIQLLAEPLCCPGQVGAAGWGHTCAICPHGA